MQTDMIVEPSPLDIIKSAPHALAFINHPTGTIRLDHPKLQCGVHYCEFVTDEFLDNYSRGDSWQLIVGIVSDAFNFYDPTSFIGRDASSFGYVVQTGQLLCCASLQDYARNVSPGGRIGIMVNFDKDEISFFRDGEDLGPEINGFAGKASHFYFGLSVLQPSAPAPAPSLYLPTLPPFRSHVVAASPFLQPSFNYSTVQHNGGEQSLSMEFNSAPSALSPALSCNIMGGEFGYLTSSTDSQSAMDDSEDEYFHFAECPEDIQLEILGWLTIPELKRTRLVSRSWRNLSDADFIWGSMVRTIIPSAPALLREAVAASYIDLYRNQTMKFTDKSLGITTTNNGRTIVSTESVTFWAASQLEYPKMNTGVHYCEFKVDTFRHGSIGNTWKVVIGVVSDDFDYQLTKWVGVDEKSFGYIAQNGKRVGPSCKNQGMPYGETYKEDDVIGVLLDITGKKIKFFKNGHPMGTAFSDAEFNQMKGHNYHFAVSIARPGMQVTAVKYEYLGQHFDSENFDPKTLGQSY